MGAIKESKQVKYDAIARGTSANIPYIVLNFNKKIEDPNGDFPSFEKNHNYLQGDIIEVEIAENKCYFKALKDFISKETFTLKGDYWKAIGQYSPYDLSNKILLLTVKKKQFDGKSDERDELPTTYNMAIRDESSLTGITYDNLFRITIDCDNKDEGEISPLWVNNGNGMKEVFHGMYGADPTLGMTTFRIPKRCTFVDPGSYYFDIRIMHKREQKIGNLRENPTFLHVFGFLDIYGTPTNRASAFSPFVYDALNPGGHP